MNKSSKILVTIGVVILFFLVFGGISAIRTHEGNKTPGFLGIIVFFAFIGALKAIWKKPKDKDKNSEEDENGNDSMLQK